VAPDGVRIAYATSGAGPPLVKAANWMSHLDHDWESPIWRHWLLALGGERTLVRYDERGCGLSDWEVGRFSFDAWVEDLEMVVDTLGLDRFPLVGLSQGGAVAIAYAVRHPERVSHLVLVGAYARGRLVRAHDDEERREAALDLEVARVGWKREDDVFRQVFSTQFLPDGTAEQWRAFNELQRRTAPAENAVRFLEEFARIDVTAEAPRVRCPALILHARGDLRVPMSCARELAALLRDSRLVTLSSRNHILTASEPAWPVLVEEIGRFLADD
jgi:pimeloyl-ACP methyl ester carboxylesterase